MTVSENLLFQMYQMMDSVKLPEVNQTTSGKESEKSSFQDLMDQTRKDAAKPEATTQSKDSPKQTKETEEKREPESCQEKEEPKLEQTNYSALSYLLRPEILMVSEETADPTLQQTVAVCVEGESTAQSLIPQTVLPEQAAPQLKEEVLTQQTTQLVQTPVSDNQSQSQPLVQAQPQQTEAPQIVVTQEKGQEPQTEASFAQTETQEGEVDLLSQPDALQQPLFREIESAPVKVGESYQLDTTSQEMTVDLTKMIDDAAAQGVQKLEIQLTPEHLGKIVVELTQNTDGVLQVVLHAANAKSTGLLSQHLDSLNSALQNLGHNQVHVEVQRNQDSSSAQQHPFQQADPDGRGQQQAQQQHKQSQSDSDDFLQQLRLGLFSLDETN